MGVQVYSRKISPEEAKESYFLIYKDKLAFFPMKGQTFDMVQGAKQFSSKVESYHCECRGPESAHEHYFIRWKGLKAGDHIVVQRDPKKSSRYSLQIRSAGAQRQMCG